MRLSLSVFLLLTLTACSLLTPLPDGSEPTVLLSAEELYSQGKAEMAEENYQKAAQIFEKLQARYPYGRYAQQAMLEGAYAYYKHDEPYPAIAAADRFIKQFPNHPNVDYAYYLKGLIQFSGEIGVLKSLSGQDPTERDPKAAMESFNAFKELTTRFPNSRYAEDSRVRMLYLANSLALYELHVARYYLRRGAQLAAINRAREVLEKFPNSPATRDALQIMVQGYDELGMTGLRDDARRVLAQNSGAMPDAAEAIKLQKSWWQFWK